MTEITLYIILNLVIIVWFLLELKVARREGYLEGYTDGYKAQQKFNQDLIVDGVKHFIKTNNTNGEEEIIQKENKV